MRFADLADNSRKKQPETAFRRGNPQFSSIAAGEITANNSQLQQRNFAVSQYNDPPVDKSTSTPPPPAGSTYGRLAVFIFIHEPFLHNANTQVHIMSLWHFSGISSCGLLPNPRPSASSIRLTAVIPISVRRRKSKRGSRLSMKASPTPDQRHAEEVPGQQRFAQHERTEQNGADGVSRT
jgi:hypothetical protein